MTILPNKQDTIRVLVVEDNPGDYTLVEEFLLDKIKDIILLHAKTFKEAKVLLSNNNEATEFSAVLLDLSLPDKTGKDLIDDMMILCKNTPVIILTGYENIQFGVKSLSLGISDYILKDELTPHLLHKSILYSIERKKLALDLISHVNAIKEQNTKLREIAWMQSHVIRAPLARVMGLIDLFSNHKNTKIVERQILGYILLSANELDKVIHDISDKVYIDS